MSMVLPSRVPPARPGRLPFSFIHLLVLTVSQLVCGLCGHGIHAHADYISIVVNHYPANQCAAYAQQVCCSPLRAVSQTHDDLRGRHICCSFAPVEPNFASTLPPIIRIASRSLGQFCAISIQTAMSLLPVPPRVAILTPPIVHSPQTPRRPPVTAPPCSPVTRRTSHSLPHTCPLPLLTPTHPTLMATQLSSHPPHNSWFNLPSLRSRLVPTRKWRIPTEFNIRTIISVSTSRTRARDFTRIIPTARRTARKPGPVNLIRYRRTDSNLHHSSPTP